MVRRMIEGFVVLVVLIVITDIAGYILFFQAPYTVFKVSGSGYGPWAN